MRHELIALHGAGTYPGAQFYPVCAQVEVTGNGNALPADSDLVAFPGAYKPDSPGVSRPICSPWHTLLIYTQKDNLQNLPSHGIHHS